MSAINFTAKTFGGKILKIIIKNYICINKFQSDNDLIFILNTENVSLNKLFDYQGWRRHELNDISFEILLN